MVFPLNLAQQRMRLPVRTSTSTDANCLNGVCFDDGNTACASLNPICVSVQVDCYRINKLCRVNPPQQNAPWSQNMRCVRIIQN